MTTTLWPQNARAVRAYWSGVEQKVDIKKRMYRSYHMVSALARNLSEIWADCSAKDRNSKEASPYGFFGYFGSCFYSQSNNLLVYHHVSPCGIIPFPLSMFSLHHARCVFGGPLCRAGGWSTGVRRESPGDLSDHEWINRYCFRYRNRKTIGKP